MGFTRTSLTDELRKDDLLAVISVRYGKGYGEKKSTYPTTRQMAPRDLDSERVSISPVSWNFQYNVQTLDLRKMNEHFS